MPKKSKRGNQRRGSGIAEKGSLPLSENVSADHQLDAVSETGIDSLKPQSPSWDQTLRSGFLGNAAGLIHPRAIEVQVNPFSPAALPNRYSIVFDMRNNFSTVLGVVGPPADLDIADKLKIEKSLISKVDITPEGFAVLVLTSHREDKFLLIQNEDNQTLCLRNSSDVIRSDIIKYLYSQDDSSLAEEKFCFYVNNNRIHSPDHSFFSTLPNLSKVKVVRVRSHILIVTHHCEPFYEKRYIVRCKNIDSLSNIREQFLRLFLSKEKIFQQLNENDIWFSFNHMILTESLLQQVFGIGFNTLDLAQRLLFQPPGSALQINFAVHFQPTDAISVPVYWKPESGASVRIPKCLLVSPSLISAQELRQEVAKILHYEPTAFNIELSNKKKLNDKTDLLQVLSTPNCGITVKPKPLITIRISVVSKPPDTNTKNKFSVHLYRNDYVYKLKSEVCYATSIPLHYVDLHSEGKVLLENKTIGENHLQDNDIVSAIVHKYRVFIIVRTLNRKWYHVVVDDCFKTTVKDVKLFAVGLDDSDRLLHDCEVLLIYQHAVLPDEHTLGEVGIQRHTQNVKLILVHSGSESFTLSSSCNGRLIIFQDTGDGRFQLVLAMSDGRSLYYTPEKIHILEKVKALVEERRATSKRIVSFVKGIRKYMIFSENPYHQKERSLQAHQSYPSSHQYCGFQNLPEIVPTWPVTLRQIGDIDINQDNPNGSVQRYNDSLQGICNNDCTQRKCIQNEPVQKESTHSETIQREQQQQHAQCEELQDNLSRIQESVMACNSTKSKTIVSSPESKEGILNSQVTMESDSLNSCRKKLAFDETKVCKWLERDNDGNTFYREKLDRVIPIENAHKAMSTSSLDSWSSSLVPRFPGTMMMYHPDPSYFQYCGPGTTMPYHLHDAEPEYKYIKKRIIMQIASNLGDEGNQVIRYLGISDSIIHQAKHAFSNNISEKYMYCLRSWCQKCGNQANKEVLKEALKKFNRVDLVNLVDEIDKEDDIILD